MDTTTGQLISQILPAIGMLLGGLGLGGIWVGFWQWRINKDNIVSKSDKEIEKLKEELSIERSKSLDVVIQTVRDNMPNCESLHTGIYNSIKGLKDDIMNVLKEKTEEESLKKRYNEILINALKVYFDKGVKNFAMYKADAFFRFIMENKDTIYKSKDNFSNAMAMINSLYLSVKAEGNHLADKEFTDMFYDQFHQESTARYIKDLEDLNLDVINNKASRFATTSMSYMEKFLSEINLAYGAFKEWQLTQLKHSWDDLQEKKKKESREQNINNN